MKTSLFAFLLLAGFQFSSYGISLADAIKQKQVSAHLRAYDYSRDSVYRPSFYGECIIAEITNLLNQPMNIELESGRFLMPDDSSIQRMMVMQPVFVTLKAKEKRIFSVQAMCTELHDGGPNNKTIFIVGKMAEGNLLKAAKFIEQNKYHTDAGQQALWVLSDKADPAGIYSEDSVQMKSLRKFVCGLLNIPVPANRVSLSDAFAGRFRTIHVTFDYTIQKPKTVKLEIYNEQGQLLRRGIDNEQVAAGDHRWEYEFTMPVNNPSNVDRKVILKFYLNGQLVTTNQHTIPNN